MEKSKFKLKKCPDCGSPARLEPSLKGRRVRVQCTKCPRRTSFRFSPEMAIKAWNENINIITKDYGIVAMTWIPESLNDTLREMAVSKECSIASIIRDAVYDYLARLNGEANHVDK